MRRKSFHKMLCPIARSLERVGEWWSMLIMRDALHGMTRFDQFQTSLGIAPNMLTRRLNSLVEARLLERRQYSEHPPRYEYLPTARGRDFFPVLVALLNFGNEHFATDGNRVVIADRKTGSIADAILVDAATGRPIVNPDYALAAGPAANRRIKQKYAAIAEARRPTKNGSSEYMRIEHVHVGEGGQAVIGNVQSRKLSSQSE